MSARLSFPGPLVASIVALGAAWTFYSHWLAPLALRARELDREASELREHIDSARDVFCKLRASEQEIGVVRTSLGKLIGSASRGSVMVSLPKRLHDHFATAGIAVQVIRLNTTEDLQGVPGYRRVFWSVALPLAETDRNASGMLGAVADFEARNRFIKVLDFSLRPDVEDPERRTASFNIAALLPK